MLIRTFFCKSLGVRFIGTLIVLSILSGSALAQPEGSIRVGLEPVVRLDPAFASSDSEIAVLNAVYDYLVDIDADNEIIPRLAREWSRSEDGLTYTFQLAEGVTFHDGSELTAEDVVFTFDRLRDPEAELPTSDLYANIASIEATGPTEVVFTLQETNPFFLFDLSDNHAVIVDSDTEDFSSTFNGTGPFVVDEYLAEDRMILSANPDYFIEGKPGLASMTLIFFSDQGAAVNAIRGGQVDLLLRMTTPLYQSLEGAQGLERLAVPTNGFDLLRLRTDRAPGNDPRVVQALKMAVDRDEILEVVTQGLAAPGKDNPIGPLYKAYHLEEPGVPQRDVDRAKQLLADAGYPDGLSLQLHTPDSGDRPDMAVVIAEQLRPAGFDVEVVVEPESVYYGENNWLEVDFGITGWGSRPVPQFYFDVMVACDARWNEAHYCNEELDQLIETAGTTLDEQERVEAYAELQRILASEGPYIIPYFFQQFGAIRDGYTGYQMKAFPGRSDLAAIQAE
jgi:peptide/nickel transport system substrate-binding protein